MPRSCNFRSFLGRRSAERAAQPQHDLEMELGKGNDRSVFTAEGCMSNNGTKSTPALSADLFGDWREEVMLRTADNKELRIFTTTIPTKHRFYTFMHDPQYRVVDRLAERRIQSTAAYKLLYRRRHETAATTEYRHDSCPSQPLTKFMNTYILILMVLLSAAFAPADADCEPGRPAYRRAPACRPAAGAS